jgi:predicted nucleotide-binding protein (sugar kinase/HSP70/actin superfamily)
MEADEVEHYIYHLRNQWGFKSRRLGAGQIVSQKRSVQGVWNPFVKYD